MLVYFFLPNYQYLYDDGIVYLAEGLEEIGVKSYSNTNYWVKDLEGNYLLQFAEEVKPQDCDVIVFSNNWTNHIDPISFKNHSNPFPNWLFNPSRKYKLVFIDNGDGYNTFSTSPDAEKFDFVLRSKTNKLTANKNNIIPWVLGYQSRILKEKLNIPIDEKANAIAVNFYFSHKYIHPLRAFAEKKFISKFNPTIINRRVTSKDRPSDAYAALMWENTFKLHNREYYNNLESTLMVAAFCGEMIPPAPYDPTPILQGGNKARIKKALYSLLSKVSKEPERVIQWDSWRFWETLALSSVPIHIDLPKYGVALPVMPENWKHYVGIDMDNIKYSVERIIEDTDTIRKIAQKGNDWCIENYSPKASAMRLLKLLQ